MPDIHQRRILIVTPTWGEYSETFIRDHADHLPGKTDVLYDIYEPNPKLLSDGSMASSFFLDNVVAKTLSSRLPWMKKLAHSRLTKLIKRVEPDVILFEYGVTAAQFVPFLENNPIPFVVHFHGFDASVESVIQQNSSDYKWLVENAHAVVAVSSEMRRKILTWGAAESKVFHIVYGVDEAAFSIADGYQHSLNFLSVGRFVEKKAPHLLLKAFSKVLEKVPECRLVMAGDGELLVATRELANDLKIADRVTFKESLSHERVSELMREAGCFVQHSVRAGNGDSEGTPVAIIEAMATGLPVVTTSHAGSKDIIEPEKTGLLVPEYDIEAMAEAMLRIAREPETASRLGAGARRFVLDNLTLSKSIAKLSDVLRISQ